MRLFCLTLIFAATKTFAMPTALPERAAAKAPSIGSRIKQGIKDWCNKYLIAEDPQGKPLELVEESVEILLHRYEYFGEEAKRYLGRPLNADERDKAWLISDDMAILGTDLRRLVRTHLSDDICREIDEALERYRGHERQL